MLVHDTEDHATTQMSRNLEHRHASVLTGPQLLPEESPL